MAEQASLTDAVLACLTYNGDLPAERRRILRDLVARVLGEDGPRLPERPQRDDLQQLAGEIRAALPRQDTKIALVYGGATKIKNYVFEAPRLPEIRGASALLDWVNQRGLRELWRARLGPLIGDDLADICVIVAGGGTFLAFAPAALGAELAACVETCYTRHTLTATSVAVARGFSLLELAYGRDPLAYWTDDFRADWDKQELQPFLASYYYPLSDPSSGASEAERRFLNRKTFGELVTLLASASARRREERGDERPDENTQRRDIVHVPLVPGALRCQSSGTRPAVVSARSGGETRALSEASALKLFTGQRMKQTGDERDWFRNAFGYIPETVEELEGWLSLRSEDERHTFSVTDQERQAAPDAWKSWEDQFRLHLDAHDKQGEYTRAWQKAGKVRPAQDMGEIAQASRPARYVGFIYADANNAGRALARLGTPGCYRQFSKKMDEAMRFATFTALAGHLAPSCVRDDQGRRRIVHPFEIITIGGDDVLLIVPGSAALEIALTLGYEFEHCRREPDAKRDPFGRYQRVPPNGHDFWSYKPALGLSAGVVIAPENTPIFFLRSLAEELLKKAKEHVRGHPEQGGAIDFMVLKSVTMVTDTIARFREQAFGGVEPCVPRATARPYLWPELQGLLATTRQLRAAPVPRSQLYRLRERLLGARHEGGITPSVIDFLHTCASGLSQNARSGLLTAMGQWTASAPGRNLAPWLHRPVRVAKQDGSYVDMDAYESILPDLVEIAEFVAEERTDA